MTELAQITNQIIGLAAQVEQLQANQEKVTTFLQQTATQTQQVERLARGTNLTMEGIARKTDDSHSYLQSLEQSIKRLQETQLDTGSLSEGVHQLISDSFIRLQRYMMDRYPSGQPLDLGQVRTEAQRDFAAALLRKLGHLFDVDGVLEHNTPPQSADFAHLQQQATALQGEVAMLANRQEKALPLLDELRHETSLFRRIVFPVAEQDKRDQLAAEVVRQLKSGTQDAQNQCLANQLAAYIAEVNTVLNGVRELRKELLSLWHDDKLADPMANGATFDFTSVTFPATAGTATQYVDEAADEEFDEEYDHQQVDHFEINESELLFQAERS